MQFRLLLGSNVLFFVKPSKLSGRRHCRQTNIEKRPIITRVKINYGDWLSEEGFVGDRTNMLYLVSL